mmetsp:Transcript_15315/g.33310  ORF Transcript_15315/g.33310 Transcript_15315/m.33310 type:complete len:101 (-) Transcript_15315:1014-1316(-)
MCCKVAHRYGDGDDSDDRDDHGGHYGGGCDGRRYDGCGHGGCGHGGRGIHHDCGGHDDRNDDCVCFYGARDGCRGHHAALATSGTHRTIRWHQSWSWSPA